MSLRQFIQGKDMNQFPPFLVIGDSFKFRIRRFYLRYGELLASFVGLLIFMSFILFCGKQNSVDLKFRIINTLLSVYNSIDLSIKLTLINPLYRNHHFYGLPFIILDILSGPMSVIFNIYNLSHHQQYTITVADILLLLKIFCLEKIRLLLKDVCYILYVSRYINYALFLCYYVYCFVAYTLFEQVSPKFFRNLYKSMLSMFQVLTLDSWNLQVNQSVSAIFGQVWSVFFLFFILFMFFYFINLLLGAFVSYYSNSQLRRFFEYDFAHDDILNPELNMEKRQSIDIKSALLYLGLDQSPYEKARRNWGLDDGENAIYMYVFGQGIFQMIIVFDDSAIISLALIIFEEAIGIFYIFQFITKLQQFIKFRQEYLEEENREDESQLKIQNDQYVVRLYVVIILFVAGPIASGVDLISLILNYQNLELRYGPALRILSVLAILYIQQLIFKFVEVLPCVTHIIIFVGGILFTMALIGHQFLKDTDVGYPLFNSLTNTYLFMLQVVTFDSWGDVARIVIKQNGVIYVLYFLFLTIFVGFFMMNMLVGVMATMTQPKTQELFEKDHVLRQRVNQKQVQQLNEQIQKYQKIEQKQLNEVQQKVKSILNEFNSSKSNEKLFIIIDGIKYEVTTKNLILFNEDQ